jgi:hypothetical protein
LPPLIPRRSLVTRTGIPRSTRTRAGIGKRKRRNRESRRRRGDITETIVVLCVSESLWPVDCERRGNRGGARGSCRTRPGSHESTGDRGPAAAFTHQRGEPRHER